MTYRIGVDIGGTFTDFAVLEEGSGRVWATPGAPPPVQVEARLAAGASGATWCSCWSGWP